MSIRCWRHWLKPKLTLFWSAMKWVWESYLWAN
ncbi:Uncharacterised protein [Vibrio cholerae]|nr:Uncharacterised protein [Vibrio cholerae]